MSLILFKTSKILQHNSIYSIIHSKEQILNEYWILMEEKNILTIFRE